METIELEQPTTETTGRLLIYQSESEVNRITQEAQTRVDLLNRILSFGIISNEDIPKVTSSAAASDDFVFREQLKVNSELKKQFDAGKKNLKDEYTLPGNLSDLKYSLLAWFNYPTTTRGGNKFENLVYTDRWKIDNEALEKFYIRYRLKIYIEGEKLNEYRVLEKLCSILQFIKMPSNQVKDSSVLWARIEPVASNQYRPRWTWFLER